MNFKRGIVDAFIVILIFLNIFDFLELLPEELDFIKKTISWVLMTYLLYHFGFTKILIGYKNKSVDTALLLSYILFIVQNFLFLVEESNIGFLKFPEELVGSIVILLFRLGIFFIFGISLFITFFVKVNDNSMLGVLGDEKHNKLIKFCITFLAISFIAYFVFMMAFEWFTIVIDAPLIMVALIYYIFMAKRYHGVDTILHKISDFGEKLLEKFITFFHYKETFALGITSILVLHFFTDLIVFIVPSFISLKDSLYHSAIDGNAVTIFEMFLKNIHRKDFFTIINLVVVYLANIVFVSVLFVSPVMILKKLYEKKMIIFKFLDNLIIIPAFIIYFLFPVYKFESIKYGDHLGTSLSGVNIFMDQVKGYISLDYALLLSAVLVLIILTIFRKGFFDFTTISLGLIVAFMFKYSLIYFSSMAEYFTKEIQKTLHFELYFISGMFLVFLLLVVMFYIPTITLFAYEIFKAHHIHLFPQEIDRQKIHNFINSMIILLFLKLFIDYIVLLFQIFGLISNSINFIIPIIITLFLFFIHKISKLFDKINFGINKYFIFYAIIVIICGYFLGAAFEFYNEPIGFTSNFDSRTNMYLFVTYTYLLFVGISEELIFRNYIQNSSKKVMSLGNAIIFQSILFTLMHLNKDITLSLFILYLLFGVFAGIIKEKVGLMNAIIFHIVANIVLYHNYLF